MKGEIDLRTPEFIASARFRRCRLYLYILIAAAAAAALLGYCLLQRNAGAMRQENARLRTANHALAAEAAPLREMQNEIALLQARKALTLGLQAEKGSWSDYLRLIEAKAPAGLHVETMVLERKGSLVIQGRGSSMQQVTGYTEALKGYAFIGDAAVRGMELEAERSYRFTIDALLIIGGAAGGGPG